MLKREKVIVQDCLEILLFSSSSLSPKNDQVFVEYLKYRFQGMRAMSEKNLFCQTVSEKILNKTS